MDTDFKPIKLPSKCLVYEGVDPDGITIRTLKGKDEKLIAEVTYDNFEKKFLLLLKSIIKGVEPAQLTVGDRLFVLLWETINSYSKDFDVDHTCSECMEKITSTVDLSELDVIELPDNFKEPYEKKLSDDSSVQLRLFRVQDEINIAAYEKSNPSSWLYRFATSLVMFKDEKEVGIWDRVSFLENLGAKDLAAIRSFHNEYAHGPKMEAEYTCSKCGGEGKVPVPFRTEMLFPYGETLSRYYGNPIQSDVLPKDVDNGNTPDGSEGTGLDSQPSSTTKEKRKTPEKSKK